MQQNYRVTKSGYILQKFNLIKYINKLQIMTENMDGSSKEADRISIQSKQSMKSFKLIEYLKKCDMEKICKNKIKLMSNEKEKEKYEQRINQKRQAILQLIINMQNLLNTTINRIKQQENQYIMKEFESQVKNMHQFIKAQVETLIAQTNKQNFEIINFLKDFIKNEPCIETNHSNILRSPAKIVFSQKSNESLKKSHNTTFNSCFLIKDQKRQQYNMTNLSTNPLANPLSLLKKIQIPKTQQILALNNTQKKSSTMVPLNTIQRKSNNILGSKLRSYSVNTQPKVNFRVQFNNDVM